MSLEALAAELAETYPDGPQETGPDGNEDEYGDLLDAAWAGLGGDPDDYGKLWQQFQNVAVASRATTYVAWLAELEAVFAIYGPPA